jgi:hypothetical protein
MSREFIPGGGFTIARQIYGSDIWQKDPLYLKIWIWILGRASHSDHEKNGYQYRRGEFVTSYNEIKEAGWHYHNRKKIYPTPKKLRVILAWLETEEMIVVKPLRPRLGPTGAATRAPTGAFIGLLIKVIKYDAYQSQQSYKGRHKGSQSTEQGHDNNNGYNNGERAPSDITEKIDALKSTYPTPQLIERAMAALASTRKTNRIADTIILAQLEKWAKYPISQVESGIRTYLERGYAAEGKKEAYLLGIIRNGTPASTSTVMPDYY